MKNILLGSAILVPMGIGGLCVASPPGETKFEDYSGLLKRSPFVIKKEAMADAAPVVNKSLSLRGVVQLDGVWRAYLVDRKDPKRTITLNLGESDDNASIALVEVKQDTENYLNTQVVVRSGGQLLTVAYNTAELKSNLAKAAVPTKTNVASPQVPSAVPNRPVIQPPQANRGQRPIIRPTYNQNK